MLSTLLLSFALASEIVVPLDGTLPDDGLDHAFLPFEVPAGTVEIEVRHDDLSEDNILDWGVDAMGGFRGWGGGNAESAVIGVEAASRSYLAGPIAPGTWQVVIGKALVTQSPATYHVEVVLRDTPTLAPQPERTPYVAAPALRQGPAWFAGDLHVHSRESGDARPSIDEVAAYAAGRGLDFVVFSDHNTVSQDDLLVDAQGRTDVLLVPGIEFTTYDGHAGAFGATRWVDHRIGQPGATIEGAADAIAAQGAVMVVNHPNLDLGDLCLGCAWDHDLDPQRIGALEVITGGWDPVGRLFFEDNLATWEAWLDRGARVAPVGGSDDHQAGQDRGPTASPIGSPTTRIYAEELSVAALTDGLRAGRTMVQLQGPDDPLLELWPDVEVASGEDVPDTAIWTATVTGSPNGVLVWIVDGEEVARMPVTGDPFQDMRTFDAPAEGLRVRLQLEVDGAPRVLTGYQWVADTPVVAKMPGGCGCAALSVEDTSGSGTSTTTSALPWGALVASALLARRRLGPRR